MKKILLAIFLSAAIFLSGCTKVSEEPPKQEETTTVSYAETEETEFVSPVYDALSDEEKLLYDKIKQAVVDFEEFVQFDEPLPRDTVRKIYRLVYSQEREYFWLSNIFYAPENEVSVLRISYLYDRDDAEMKRTELDFVCSEIIGKIPDGASDFDKVVFLHDYIVTSCSFTSEKEHVNSAYGVLVTGNGQCEGYAAAMSMLCDKAGIPNYTVCGENSDGRTHAWNKVLLNGNWYNADCTWDDPIIKVDNPDFVRHDYLLVKDSEIEGITHFTDELYQGYTVCESDELNYFRGKDMVYTSEADGIAALEEQVRMTGLAGTREVEIRFADKESYNSAVDTLFDNGGMKDIIEDVNERYGTGIRSAYKHNNNEMRIVHISLIYDGEEY